MRFNFSEAIIYLHSLSNSIWIFFFVVCLTSCKLSKESINYGKILWQTEVQVPGVAYISIPAVYGSMSSAGEEVIIEELGNLICVNSDLYYLAFDSLTTNDFSYILLNIVLNHRKLYLDSTQTERVRGYLISVDDANLYKKTTKRKAQEYCERINSYQDSSGFDTYEGRCKIHGIISAGYSVESIHNKEWLECISY